MSRPHALPILVPSVLLALLAACSSAPEVRVLEPEQPARQAPVAETPAAATPAPVGRPVAQTPAAPTAPGPGHAQLLDKARSFERAGQTDAAIQLYAAALAAWPNDEPLLDHLLELLRGAQRWEEAAAAYDRVIAARPDDARLHLGRGDLLRDAGRPIGAWESYRRAAQLDPTSSVAWFELGLVLLDLELYSEASGALQHAVANDPENAEAHRAWARALRRLDRRELESVVLARAEQLDPEHAERDARDRAAAYHAMDRPDQVLTVVDELLVASPEDTGLLLARADALAALGDRHAREAYGAVLEVDAQNERAATALAALPEAEPSPLEETVRELLRSVPAGEWVEALAALDTAAPRPEEAALHIEQGAERLSVEDPVGAWEHLQRAVELDPGSAQAHFELGMVYLELDLDQEAADSLRRAIDLEPGHYSAHHHLGATLIELGRYELAVPVLARAEALAPGGVLADGVVDGGLRARAYRALGRDEDALALVETLIARDPGNASLHVTRGELLLALGMQAEAATALGRALELDPDNEEALQLLRAAQPASDVKEEGGASADGGPAPGDGARADG